MDSVAAIVKSRREAKKWSQRDLSERADLTQPRIAQIEKGKDNVSIDTLAALARAFNCAPVDLLPDEFKHPPTAQKAA